MLQGVVSILDDEHCDKIEALWRLLEDEFELKAACVAYPHVSYQVVERYEIRRAHGVLKRFTNRAAPFTLRTSGLGIFTGESPVIYVSVARSAALSAFHTKLWGRMSPTAQGIHSFHYGPDNFMPHITLAAGDLLPEQVPDVIRLLAKRPFAWNIPIDNLALVLDAKGTRDQWIRFPFENNA